MEIKNDMTSLEVYEYLENIPHYVSYNYVGKRHGVTYESSDKSHNISYEELMNKDSVLVKNIAVIGNTQMISFYWFTKGKFNYDGGATYFKFEKRDDYFNLYSFDYIRNGEAFEIPPDWLKENGINPYFFTDEDVIFIKMKFWKN